MKNSFKWLPPGWLLEIRTQRHDSKARQIFKVLWKLSMSISPDIFPWVITSKLPYTFHAYFIGNMQWALRGECYCMACQERKWSYTYMHTLVRTPILVLIAFCAFMWNMADNASVLMELMFYRSFILLFHFNLLIWTSNQRNDFHFHLHFIIL